MNDAPIFDGVIPMTVDDCERCTLGCLMLGGADATVSVQLCEDAFRLPSHQAIYRAVAGLIEDAESVDVSTVAVRLEANGELADVGLGLLNSCVAELPHASHADFYSRHVINAWADRRSTHAADMLKLGKMTRTELRFELDQIEATSVGRRVHRLGEAIQEFENNRHRPRTTLKTGMYGLDQMLDGGFEGGQLVILAARTGVGKTAFATSVLCNISRRDQGALICSLEMTRHELVERMIATESTVPLTAIRRRCETDDQSAKRLRAQSTLYTSRVKIDDTSSTFGEIQRQALHHQGTIDLLIVDYLQLVRSEGDARIPREQQVASVSRGLKLLAKELDIPVLALAQMNRSVEKRPNGTPLLSDLRESGAIEQDANVVMFLHAVDDRPQERQVIVAKNRSGQTGAVQLQWLPHTTTIRDAPTQVDTSNFGDF